MAITMAAADAAVAAAEGLFAAKYEADTVAAAAELLLLLVVVESADGSCGLWLELDDVSEVFCFICLSNADST